MWKKGAFKVEILFSLIVLIGQLAAESAQKKKAEKYADMVARRYRKRFK